MYSNFLPNSVGVHIFQASILTLANLTNVVIKINLMLISEGPNLHLLKLFFASLILIVSILQRFLDSGVSIEQSVEPSTAMRPPAVRINLIIWIATPLVGTRTVGLICAHCLVWHSWVILSSPTQSLPPFTAFLKTDLVLNFCPFPHVLEHCVHPLQDDH